MKPLLWILCFLTLLNIWSVQAYFYPKAFADWRMLRAMETWLEDNGHVSPCLRPGGVINIRPQSRNPLNAFGWNDTRRAPWVSFGIACDFSEGVFMAPNGTLHVVAEDDLGDPLTSFHSSYPNKGTAP